MGFLIRTYDKMMCWTSGLSDLFLLAIRLIWGWQFIWSGWGKLTSVADTAKYFESLGLSDPETMVHVVGGIEAICGTLILLGLVTRLAALPLVAAMIGAYLTAHTEAAYGLFTHFDTFTKEPPFLFLFTSLILLCFGPGKLSIDYLIRGKEIGGKK